jgi:outer membrane protein TolC
VQVSIAAEVALDYITLRGTQARLAIASDNLAIQQEKLQITQRRLQAGLVTEVEAEQARTAVEQTRAQLPALRTGIEQTRHALAVLTGRPPAARRAAQPDPIEALRHE